MLWNFLIFALCLSYGSTLPTDQKLLIAKPYTESTPENRVTTKHRALQGRYLHITGTACFQPAVPTTLLRSARLPS